MSETNVHALRKKFIANPPEGFTKKEILQMTDDEILDMNYFLYEDDPFEELCLDDDEPFILL